METFSNTEIENYYDQTEIHYRRFLKLDKVMGLHYGIWDSSTSTVEDAILNTNKQLMLLGAIKPTDRVLDAGCGVGGSSIYLAKNLGCRVTGITLSEKQTRTGSTFAKREGVDSLVDFKQQDFTNTNFEEDTFDIAWAMESMCHAEKKYDFFKEMSRVVKKGGRVVISDFFKTRKYHIDEDKDMLMMFNGWAVPDIDSVEETIEFAEVNGFKLVENVDRTVDIKKTVNILYKAYLIGGWASRLYNLLNKVSRFSKIHYKTARAQYKAYNKKLWCYHQLCFEKL